MLYNQWFITSYCWGRGIYLLIGYFLVILLDCKPDKALRDTGLKRNKINKL